MIQKVVCICWLLCMPFLLAAQQYSVLTIADSLRRDADVVKRSEEYIITIQSPAKYTCYEKHVYTILNQHAAAYGHYVSSYNRFTSTSELLGKMYDAIGREIRHTKKNDWKDYAAYDGFSLLSDARYKEVAFVSAEYPYTVAFEEEQVTNGTQGFPRWMPQSQPFMSVESSKFTIIAPADYKVRYKQLNLPGGPLIETKGNTKSYTWQICNLPAKKAEVGAPPFSELVPAVLIAPSTFEVQGYTGDMSSWQQFGQFMYQLIKGRDELPPSVKQQVHALVDTVADNYRKIQLLYNFLQQNTRYISIQLGIGGWQPFEASYVAEKKYGDCKALSNYMIALLKEAGLTGKYVEIYAGKQPPAFHEDFPSSQANHVICCVPLERDTVWLECTSQTVAAGYMGSFTGNRKAILVDESGSHIVHTPVYTAADNRQVRKVNATLDAEGNMIADVYNRYSGLQQETPHALMTQANKEEREKYLNRLFKLPTYKVLKSDYREIQGRIPVVEEQLQISCANYASATGKRLFINLNMFEGIEKLAPDSARRFDFMIDKAYRNIDSIEITIPAGYQVESMPKPVQLTTSFGKYQASIQVSGNTIRYYRSMEQESIRVPAASFGLLVDFYEQLNKADKARIVLVRQE